MSEDYNKTSLEQLKENIIDWLDYNMDLQSDRGEEEPEFYLKREDKKLFIKVTEKGGRDIDNCKDYFMVLESLKDESEMDKEIETE